MILDGQTSRKPFNGILKARKNNINILALHPHNGHKMQPPDLDLFGSLKKLYTKNVIIT